MEYGMEYGIWMELALPDMMASSGYPRTVIPAGDRKVYMHALEKAASHIARSRI